MSESPERTVGAESRKRAERTPGGKAGMTAIAPTRSSAPDYDEIVRVVHLYSDAFGAGNIIMFEAAFHEHAWISTPTLRFDASA